MSQAKVDRYKEEKRNRAKIMKKEKREALLGKICGCLVACALVVWAGVSVYQNVTNPSEDVPAEIQTYTVDTSALDDFIGTLSEN